MVFRPIVPGLLPHVPASPTKLSTNHVVKHTSGPRRTGRAQSTDEPPTEHVSMHDEIEAHGTPERPHSTDGRPQPRPQSLQAALAPHHTAGMPVGGQARQSSRMPPRTPDKNASEPPLGVWYGALRQTAERMAKPSPHMDAAAAALLRADALFPPRDPASVLQQDARKLRQVLSTQLSENRDRQAAAMDVFKQFDAMLPSRMSR